MAATAVPPGLDPGQPDRETKGRRQEHVQHGLELHKSKYSSIYFVL
jgi:hypothetical protein